MKNIHPNRLYSVDLTPDEALELVKQLRADAGSMEYEPFLARYFTPLHNKHTVMFREIRRQLFILRRMIRTYAASGGEINDGPPPEAYIAGILQLDGKDLDGAEAGDLFVVMKDTQINRQLQTDLLHRE